MDILFESYNPIFEEFNVRVNPLDRFNTLNSEINFLVESVESDIIYMDRYLTEADDESDGAASAIADKILAAMTRLSAAIKMVINRIKEFIGGKIRDFKEKNLIKKIKNKKLTKEESEKIAAKIEKIRLLDPDKTFNLIEQIKVDMSFITDPLADVFGDKSETVRALCNALTNTDIEIQAKGVQKDAKRQNNDAAKEISDIWYHNTEPQQLVNELDRLYAKTTEAIEKMKPGLEEKSKAVDAAKKKVESLKHDKSVNKDELRACKNNLKDLTIAYNAELKLSNKLIKQEQFLEQICLLLIGKKESNEGEDKPEKADAEVVGVDKPDQVGKAQESADIFAWD